MKKKHSEKPADSRQKSLVKIPLFGIGITSEKKEKVLEFVVNSLQKRETKYFIVTPNPEIVVYASKHQTYKNILNAAEVALCDGTQLFRSARLLGKQLQERISGVDFMEELCAAVSKKPITVGFLGGRNDVAELTAQCLTKKYPGLRVVFAGEEPPTGWSMEKGAWGGEIRQQSPASNLQPDILFVAFGFPKQEEWMYTNLDKYPVKVMMGIGGAFDYLSGRVPRAPKFVQQVGLEWLYRLIIQPWRIKRQMRLIEFVWMVLKEKFRFRIYDSRFKK